MKVMYEYGFPHLLGTFMLEQLQALTWRIALPAFDVRDFEPKLNVRAATFPKAGQMIDRSRSLFSHVFSRTHLRQNP